MKCKLTESKGAMSSSSAHKQVLFLEFELKVHNAEGSHGLMAQ